MRFGLIVSAIVGVSLLAVAPNQAAAKPHSGGIAPDVGIDGERLLVKLKKGASVTRGADLDGDAGEVRNFRAPKRARSADLERWRVVQVKKGSDVEKVRARLQKHPKVELVEYNYEF